MAVSAMPTTTARRRRMPVNMSVADRGAGAVEATGLADGLRRDGGGADQADGEKQS